MHPTPSRTALSGKTTWRVALDLLGRWSITVLGLPSTPGQVDEDDLSGQHIVMFCSASLYANVVGSAGEIGRRIDITDRKSVV